MSAPVVDLDTPQGPAQARLHEVPGARAALLLGHGAGGGIDAPDLLATTEAANALGLSVALVLQPYRVAGKGSTPRPPVLDEAWVAVARSLAAEPFGGLPLLAGGRSSGARVACRTAGAIGAVGVIALAFPLRPPARSGRPRGPSRRVELDAVDAPVLVVQGERDPFGVPARRTGRRVVRVPGDHALRDRAKVGAAVARWLPGVLG